MAEVEKEKDATRRVKECECEQEKEEPNHAAIFPLPEEEGLGQESKRAVRFDKEVDQVLSHVPLNFLLKIDESDVWQRLILGYVRFQLQSEG